MRTQVVLHKGAELLRNRPLVGRRPGEEDIVFQVAHEKDVAVLLEPTAPAAGDADRPGRGYGPVHLLVKLQHLAAQLACHESFPHFGFSYSRITLSRRVISSAEMRFPCPEPGQIEHVC